MRGCTGVCEEIAVQLCSALPRAPPPHLTRELLSLLHAAIATVCEQDLPSQQVLQVAQQTTAKLVVSNTRSHLSVGHLVVTSYAHDVGEWLTDGSGSRDYQTMVVVVVALSLCMQGLIR